MIDNISYLMIFCLLTILSCNGSTNYDDTYNRGRHFRAEWILIVTISLLGIIMNSMILYFYLSNRISNPKAKIYPSSSCFAMTGVMFCLNEFIKTIINLSQNHYVGGNYYCQIDSYINTLFFLWPLSFIACMSVTTFREINGYPIKTNIETFSIIFLSFLYAVITSIVCTFLSKSEIDSTGIYCIINYKATSAMIFLIIIGIVLPLVIIIERMVAIRSIIIAGQNLLKQQNKNYQSNQRHQLLFNLVILTTISYLICSITIMLCGLYQWITNDSPALYWNAIGSIIFLLYFALIQPIFSINYYPEIKNNFWINYGQYLSFIYKLIHKYFYKYFHIKIYIDLNYNTNNINITNINDLNDYMNWLNNNQLRNIFDQFAKDNYVAENLLFYNDVINYKELGNKMITLISINIATKSLLLNDNITEKTQRTIRKSNNRQQSIRVPSLNSNVTNNSMKNTAISERNEEEQALWYEIYEKAVSIYKIYIQVPSAPLEINIPDIARENINKLLQINIRTIKQKHKQYILDIPPFPDLYSNNVMNNNNDSCIQNDSVKNDILNTNESMKIIIKDNMIDNVNDNINHNTKDSTKVSLKDSMKATKDMNDSLKATNDTQTNTKALIEEYISLYDNALIAVDKIIETDIFPRFKKSNLFQDFIEEITLHNKLMEDIN